MHEDDLADDIVESMEGKVHGWTRGMVIGELRRMLRLHYVCRKKRDPFVWYGTPKGYAALALWQEWKKSNAGKASR